MSKVYERRPKRTKLSIVEEDQEQWRKQQCCLVPLTPTKPLQGRPATMRVYSRKKLATQEKDRGSLSGNSFAISSSKEKITLFGQQEIGCDKPPESFVTMISSVEKNVPFSSCVALTESIDLGSGGIIDLNMSLNSQGMIDLNTSDEKQQSCAPGLIDSIISKEHGSDGTRGYCLESTGSPATSKGKEHSFYGIDAGSIDLNKSIYSDGPNDQAMQTNEGAVIDSFDIFGSLEMNKGLNYSNSESWLEPNASRTSTYARVMSQDAATGRKSENFTIKETGSEKLSSNFKLAHEIDVNDCIDSRKSPQMKPQRTPRKKIYRPRVLIDGQPTPKRATPEKKSEKVKKVRSCTGKKKVMNESTSVNKYPVARAPATPEKKTEKLKKVRASGLKKVVIEGALESKNLPDIKSKCPVARALDFQRKISDFNYMDYCFPLLNQKKRSKRRRKLNWFTFPIMAVTIKGKNNKKKLFVINWGQKKRIRHRKRLQKVLEKSFKETEVDIKVDSVRKETETAENVAVSTEMETANNVAVSTMIETAGCERNVSKGKCKSTVKKVTHKRKCGKSSLYAITIPEDGKINRRVINSIIRELKSLYIDNKDDKKSARVDLDTETLRVWNLLMNGNDAMNLLTDGDDAKSKEKEENEKRWEKEREIFYKRVFSFNTRMYIIQGDRGFKQWNGSVLDSVIGVFLTQNVSDNLSSDAFMLLAAKFPSWPKCQNRITYSQKPVGSTMEAIQIEYDLEGNQYFVSQPESETNKELEAVQIEYDSEGNEYFLSQPEPEENKELGRATEALFDWLNYLKILGDSDTESKSTSGGKKKNTKKAKDEINWDWLRIKYSTGQQRSSDQMDSVDWEAVRLADLNEVALAIQKRGQHTRLAENIQKFLNRVVEQHKCLDLEWLRNTPPDKTKEYLLSVYGLGLKSVECIRLLSLKQVAFPVDSNVARIAVRLGWVPLQPLPEKLELHLLEKYPDLDPVQIFLWPRLCTLPQEILYELHYQMITFGKVFCTKKNPNCNDCPMRKDCKHFASALASRTKALPNPFDKMKVSSAFSKGPTASSNCFVSAIPLLESERITKICEPIIEEPFEPEAPKLQESETEPKLQESEVEHDSEGIPIIKINDHDFKKTSCTHMNNNNIMFEDGDNSKTLVSLTPESASIPTRKLKRVSRLRTEHLVYELPRNHCLLELLQLEKTESDKDVQYHLAIWTPGEIADSLKLPKKTCCSMESELCSEETCYECNNIREQKADIVRATLLIPCRVATRRSFPLNGTYFQVNEVFADHETSLQPLKIPRALIYNLRTKIAYFGTSIRSIFSGLSMLEIQQGFWKGIICIRGYDRREQAPRPLLKRFHCPQSKMRSEKCSQGQKKGQGRRPKKLMLSQGSMP